MRNPVEFSMKKSAREIQIKGISKARKKGHQFMPIHPLFINAIKTSEISEVQENKKTILT